MASSSSQSPLRPTEIITRIRAQFGQDVLQADEVHGHAVVTVTPERYHELCAFLRDDRDIDCDFIDFLTGVGLDQWGARALAVRGFTFGQILKYYYTGVRIQPRH